jgi:serine/threonine protein kinase
MEVTTGVHQEGGDILGRGSFGCVFMPPLACKGVPPLENSPFIDKLTTISIAEHERAIAKRIQKLPLWKNYFVVAESMCEPAPAVKQTDKSFKGCKLVDPEHLDQYRLLRMRYGGTSLTSHRMDFSRHSFYDFATHLIEGGAILALYGLVHMDIHSSNIVVNHANVPRFIDFNLTVDIKQKGVKLSQEYMPELPQISPDNSLVKALGNRRGMDAIQDILTSKRNIIILSSVLGISVREQQRQLIQFYKNSTSIQTGDIRKWFKHYWRVQDSWAIGYILTGLLAEMSRWPSFAKSDYASYSDKLLPILRSMCALSPRNRIDCVQALERLDPNNYLFRAYPAAKEWLARVKTL